MSGAVSTRFTELAERTVVITGGASGMGAATARAFSSLGASVVIIDRDVERAHVVGEEVDAVRVETGDVSDSGFCDSAVAAAYDATGRVDVLVNCAGVILRAGGLDTDDLGWRRIMGVNVDGTFFMCRAALPHMVAQQRGSIINFGSIWGDIGAAGVTAYCASKGAVHQITKSLALDHATDGIRVNAVAPGEVDTPMLSSGRDHRPSAADLQKLADSSIPVKRLARPDEIAAVVVFLASDAASYMTGAIVPVDGGYTAR